MRFYQITDRGISVARNVALPHKNEYEILYKLNSVTSATRDKLCAMSGFSAGEVAGALAKLQRAGLVQGV